MRLLLAGLMRFLHLLTFLFIVFGFLLPWWQAWVIHAPFTVLTRIHWKVNQRRCILTTWEVQLKGDEFVSDHEEGWFVKEVFETITGWRPPTDFTRRLMMFWMYSAVVISCYRLWLAFG